MNLSTPVKPRTLTFLDFMGKSKGGRDEEKEKIEKGKVETGRNRHGLLLVPTFMT